MPEQHPTYAFVSGEIGPDAYGRPDLSKYDLGMALARNYFVNYRGALVSRPGTESVGKIASGGTGFSIQRFKTSTDDLLLEFGHNTMRVVQDGGYVTDLSATITAYTIANPAVFTATGHGFTSGDQLYLKNIVGEELLNERFYIVTVLGANTFTLVDVFGNTVDSTPYDAYVSGGTAERTFTLTTVFDGADVANFSYEQEQDEMVITGDSTGVYELAFTSTTSWALTLETFIPTEVVPTNVTLTPSTAGTAGMAFAVSAIIDGKESAPSEYVLNELSVNYTDEAGSMLVEWDAVSGATKYNIYRSLILPTGTEISLAQEVGYIGQSRSPQFTDTNIIGDFTKSPSILHNPFANGQVLTIDVTAGGTGYSKSDTVSVSGGGGSGFSGYPVVNASGVVIGVVVTAGGSGYSSPVVTITSSGTGATATATLGASTGNQPTAYKKFQQRGVYVGVPNFPMTIFASKPGLRSNMSVSTIVNAGDGYTFTLDSGEPKGIKHMVTLKSGLLLMTDEGVTQLRAEEGRAVSGINALAEQQIYKGVSDVKPLIINNDVLFLQAEGSALNVMVYTAYTQSFELQDISVLSNHLLANDNRGVRMEYVDEPYRMIYIPREDGALITCAYERAQDVFGWTRYTTQGMYRDCTPIKEGTRTTMYYAVERYLHGQWVWMLEREKEREQLLEEDVWAVDCGLSYLPTPVAAEATLVETVAETTWTVETDSAVFTAGNVGDIIYIHGGKLEIDTFTSTTEVICSAHRAPTAYVHERTGTDMAFMYPPATSETWSMGTPETALNGLWHLEGKTVSILADGSAFLEAVVTDGKITLDQPATKIMVGLGYTCLGKTLDLSARDLVVHTKRKKVYSVDIRLQNSRGVEVGDSPSRMYAFREETDDVLWGNPPNVVNGTEEVAISHGWKRDAAIYIQQRWPLPATINAFLENYDVGDS